MVRVNRAGMKGGALDRDDMFTYFLQAPPVSDWLPPAVAVHSGDWKLIRLFHAGEDGDHDYRLYNLADDIGEQNDLEEYKPELIGVPRQRDAS